MSNPVRPPLSDSEKAEKERLKRALERVSLEWTQKGSGKLTQQRIGEITGEVLGREPFSQGMVWQYTSPKSDTKLNPEFVQACSVAFDIPIDEISPRFRPISPGGPRITEACANYQLALATRIKQAIDSLPPDAQAALWRDIESGKYQGTE